MNDNEDFLRNLFDSYNPKLSPSADFMQRLDDRLRAVDQLRVQAVKRRRISRMALAVAFLCGIACGALLTLFFPLAEGFFAMAFAPLLPLIGEPVAFVASTFTWICFGILTIFLAFNAYDLTYALLDRRSK